MLPVAKILKSNGVDGDLLVSSAYALEDLDPKEPVFIIFDGLQVPFFIQSLKPKGGKYILHLNDIDTLEDADEVAGRDILLDLEDDGSDDLDFTGWTIQDRGRTIGECTGMEPIPGNPCLYIGETLVPLHEDLILSIDEHTRTLDLNLPEGLI